MEDSSERNRQHSIHGSFWCTKQNNPITIKASVLNLLLLPQAPVSFHSSHTVPPTEHDLGTPSMSSLDSYTFHQAVSCWRLLTSWHHQWEFLTSNMALVHLPGHTQLFSLPTSTWMSLPEQPFSWLLPAWLLLFPHQECPSLLFLSSLMLRGFHHQGSAPLLQRFPVFCPTTLAGSSHVLLIVTLHKTPAFYCYLTFLVLCVHFQINISNH